MSKLKLVSLGCSKNTVDSEKIAGLLQLNEWTVVPIDSNESVDLTLINTCGFIADAKDESVQHILRAVTGKQTGRTKKIFVMGCLAERYRKDLQQEIPEIDKWFGAAEMDKVIEAVQELSENQIRNEIKLDALLQTVTNRAISTYPHTAYLKISEGCNRTCSFCAIPLIRGKQRSAPMETLVKEAQELANKGVKELIIIAQDVTSYGTDIYGKRSITELLKALLKIKEIEWFRLQYLYPHGFPDDLLDLIASEPRICKYIDIPLQHIDTTVLRSMQRATTEEDTLALLEKIRTRLPDAAIRTTLIVGYPEETEEAYEKLKSFVEKQKFDRLGVFTYSPEEGTPAFPLKDPVPAEEKQRRADEIMLLQEEISLAGNEAKKGQILKVLIDKIEGESYAARTEYDSIEVDNQVWIETNKSLKPGTFVQVRITDAEPYDMFGELV
ncbi:MAG: 30S ribosomal protein S12 methylthiotransferase RimO [Bacteroidales bacterium]|jgi:ribosomal protein S12 methylthiotransferase|nr:30S ribosomal protein S12 methylthiotransferase RimO [Bacteroidales bacterium]